MPGFESGDITYHRAVGGGTVRVAFDRADVRNAFRPQTVDELYADDCVGEETWNAAAAIFTEAEMLHLVMAAGCYRVVSGVLNSCGVQLDEGVPGWPTPPESDEV